MENIDIECVEKIKQLFDDFKYFSKYGIDMPVKISIELINLLLHTFGIYKQNEMVQYTILNGDDVITKKSIFDKGDTKNHPSCVAFMWCSEEVKVLSITPNDLKTLCESIPDCNMESIETKLKCIFS